MPPHVSTPAMGHFNTFTFGQATPCPQCLRAMGHFSTFPLWPSNVMPHTCLRAMGHFSTFSLWPSTSNVMPHTCQRRQWAISTHSPLAKHKQCHAPTRVNAGNGPFQHVPPLAKQRHASTRVNAGNGPFQHVSPLCTRKNFKNQSQISNDMHTFCPPSLLTSNCWTPGTVL